MNTSGQALTMRVKGRDNVQGLPKVVEITVAEVEQSMKPKLMQIVGIVKSVLEEVCRNWPAILLTKG